MFLTIAELDSPLGHDGHPQLFALVDAERHVHTRADYAGIDPERSSLNHIAFEIDEGQFAAEIARLEGMDMAVETMEFPHVNAKGLFFRDPEGNLIELIGSVR